MSPEQLEGKEADVRSDIFALGAEKYEMATDGKRAFEGQSQASLIAAIMRGEPRPPSALTPMTPPALERLVLSCLAKNPDDRRQSIRDVALDLEWIQGGGGEVSGLDVARAGRPWAWMSAAAALAVAAIALGWMALTPKAAPPRTMTLSFAMPQGVENSLYAEQLTISPDGRSAAFLIYEVDGGRSLWVRDLDSVQARSLPGTKGAAYPFWSPDSRFLGFFSDGKLKRIDTTGGPPQTLCATTDPYGGTWNREGLILFGDGQTRTIEKVSASGGTPEAVTRLGPTDEGHRWPAFLPDGRHFVLLMDAANTEDHHLGVASLDSLDVSPLFNMISNVAYVEPGYLLFVRSGTLIAQPFDTRTLKPSGDPIALADNLVELGFRHRMEFSASDTGILTYRSVNLDSRIAWVDRTGNTLESFGEKGRYEDSSLSPDESRVAFGKLDTDARTGDLWVLDLCTGRGFPVRLSIPERYERPNGLPMAGRSPIRLRTRGPAPASMRSASTASVRRRPCSVAGWTAAPGLSPPTDASSSSHATTREDGVSGSAPQGEPAQATKVVAAGSNAVDARFSPDGRWISYGSDETGREEVYVQDFPAMSKKVLVSTGGGYDAEWRSDGREIYYVDDRNRLNAVTLSYGGNRGIEASAPRELFALKGNSYAPAADGSRFLVDLPASNTSTPPFTVVLDWTSALAGR